MLIDLDTAPARDDEPAGRPGIPTRPLLGALCLLLVALLAGSGRQAHPARPVIVPAALSDQMFVGDGRLFVVSASHTTLRTYRLPDARPLGSAVLHSVGEVSDVRQIGGTILVTDQGFTTVAVDAATGRQLWRLSGAAIVASADVVLWGGGEKNRGFHAVDLRTGSPRWSLPEPPDGFLSFAQDRYGVPRWLISMTDGGRLTTYDARTGARLAAVAVPPFRATSDAVATAVGDLFVYGGGARGVTAYELPSLTPRWHAPAGTAQSWMQDQCGPVICDYSQQGMTAVDPATGRVVWTAARWQYAEPLGGYLIATTVPSGTDAGKLSVLDPATGRLRGDFGTWQGVHSPGGLRYAVHVAPTPYAVLYGELDPAHGSVRILGEARRVSGNCVADSGALVCHLLDASLAVWKLG